MSSRQMRPELVEGPTMHPSAGSGRIRRDRGQGTIEFMAMVPLVLVVLVVRAAGDDARPTPPTPPPRRRATVPGPTRWTVAGRGRQASLPGGVELVNVSTYGPDHGVEVTVQAPVQLIRSSPTTGSPDR